MATFTGFNGRERERDLRFKWENKVNRTFATLRWRAERGRESKEEKESPRREGKCVCKLGIRQWTWMSLGWNVPHIFWTFSPLSSFPLRVSLVFLLSLSLSLPSIPYWSTRFHPSETGCLSWMKVKVKWYTKRGKEEKKVDSRREGHYWKSGFCKIFSRFKTVQTQILATSLSPSFLSLSSSVSLNCPLAFLPSPISHFLKLWIVTETYSWFTRSRKAKKKQTGEWMERDTCGLQDFKEGILHIHLFFAFRFSSLFSLFSLSLFTSLPLSACSFPVRVKCVRVVTVTTTAADL